MIKRLLKSVIKISLFFGCFFLSSVSAQVNFLPGYVITSRGDTLHGFIDYRNWGKNPDNISFKKNVDDETTGFTPIDIKEFYVQDEQYVGAIVPKEISPVYLNYLDDEPEFKIRKDTVFLQTMIRGKLSLLYLKDENGSNQFYINTDTGYVLLLFKKYFKISEGKKVVMENRRFVAQLNYLLHDCEDIANYLKSLEYKKQDMEKVMTQYYNCVNEQIIFQKKTEKNSSAFGLIIGPSITKSTFKGSLSNLSDIDFDPSIDLAGGLYFNSFLSRNRKQWSISNYLFYTHYEIQGSVEDEFSQTDIQLAFSYLKYNPRIQYTSPGGKYSFILNGGFSMGIVVNSTNLATKHSSFFPDYEKPALEDIREFEMGLTLGAGLAYGRFSFESMLEFGNGVSAYANTSNSTTRVYFFVGYRLKG